MGLKVEGSALGSRKTWDVRSPATSISVDLLRELVSRLAATWDGCGHSTRNPTTVNVCRWVVQALVVVPSDLHSLSDAGLQVG